MPLFRTGLNKREIFMFCRQFHGISLVSGERRYCNVSFSRALTWAVRGHFDRDALFWPDASVHFPYAAYNE